MLDFYQNIYTMFIILTNSQLVMSEDTWCILFQIIYVCRNPKDVFHSFYRIMLWDEQIDESPATFNRFFQDWMDGKCKEF